MAAVDMQARVASLEQELSSVKAQADSDAINAEHQSQAMEARYNALEAEHSQVSGDFALPVSRPNGLHRSIARVQATVVDADAHGAHAEPGSTVQRRVHRASRQPVSPAEN